MNPADQLQTRDERRPSGGLVQALSLYQREGHLQVQQCVVGQVDFLLAALSQDPFDLIAAVGEGRGMV